MAAIDAFEGALCHYTTAEVAFGHILSSGQLRMSPHARMRDPFENRALPFSIVGPDPFSDAQLERFVRIVDLVRDLRSASRLLSFSVDASTGYDHFDAPFMRGWARARMWEQYASNHSGVCLALDRLLLENQIEAELEPLGSVHSGTVLYTARGFSETSSSALVLESFRDDQLEEDVAAYVMNHVDDMFFTKTLDWIWANATKAAVPANAAVDIYAVWLVPISYCGSRARLSPWRCSVRAACGSSGISRRGCGGSAGCRPELGCRV